MILLLRIGLLIGLGSTAFAATPDAVAVDRAEFFSHVEHYKLPLYPDKSVADRRAGTVTVRIFVDVYGAVQNVDVQVPPDAQMGESVKQAVSAWTFRPFHTDVGKPQAVVCTIHVLFRIAAEGPSVIVPGLTKIPETEYRKGR